jgi:O-antigen ligase
VTGAGALSLDPAVSSNSDVSRRLRSALMLAAFLLTWVTVNPFPDLSDPRLLDPIESGNLLSQISALLLSAALLAFVWRTDTRVFVRAFTPLLVVVLAWFALSAVFSANAGLAGRRLVLAVLTIMNAAAFLLLPVGREHFARVLAVGALIILVLCYGGVIFFPARAIHQLADVFDSGLAGDWRGVFGQKNGTGAAMVVLIFIGIFVARTVSVSLGSVIAALAAVFLFFTHAKSSTALLPVVLVLGFLIMRVRSPAIKVALALAVPLVIHVLTIGSVSFEPIKAVLDVVLPDATFTNRDEIWRLVLDQISQRPLVGFGFQAFWGTSDLILSAGADASWAYTATDAHNALLNLAVTTGLVGAALATVWIFAQPMRDLIRVERSDGDRATAMLFLQIWLFGLCLSGFESVFFSGGSDLWFMMLVAILGLRFMTVARLER